MHTNVYFNGLNFLFSFYVSAKTSDQVGRFEYYYSNHKHLLVTEFEGRSVSYRLRFFSNSIYRFKGRELKWKRQGVVSYSIDREISVIKLITISLGN